MATVRIPNLTASIPVVDAQGRMTPEFLRRLNDAFQSLAVSLNAISAIPEIRQALEQLDQVTQAAKEAAEAAQTAADNAQGSANNASREAALANSYIDPSVVLMTTPTIITIAAHTRFYADGTSVAVDGGTVPTTGAGDVDYVSYNDPDRLGGAVTYQVSTTNPVQTGNTHVVGAVSVPATGSNNGGSGPRAPGTVEP